MRVQDLREKQMVTTLGLTIFEELCLRRKEQDRLKKKASYTGYFLILLSAALVADLFFFQTKRLASLEQLRLLTTDPLVLILVALTVFTLFMYQKRQKDADDAEDDFDQLREEAIDRSWEIWPRTLDQASREQVMRDLLDNEKINLYYK
ncbi:MAG: DUF2663 family protein [Sporolactobacillus sp.]